MSNAKTTTEVTQEKKLREKELDRLRQKKRRELLTQKHGKIVPVHMKEETLNRLEKIFCKVTQSRNQNGEAEKRSTAITELINQYYIDNILRRQHATSEETYEIYNLIWQANVEGKPASVIIRELNGDSRRIPFLDEESGKIMFDDGEWVSKDIDTFSDTGKVIEMIESNERRAIKKPT